MFFLDVVDLDFRGSAAFGVIGCEAACLLKSAVRKFSVRSFDNDMGACHLFGVEPPVVSGCLFESQLIILEVIFADEDIKSVTGNIVEWFGLGLRLCTFFARIMFFDVAVLGQLFLDLA